MCPKKPHVCAGQLGVSPACCHITSCTDEYVPPLAQEPCTELEEEEAATKVEEEVTQGRRRGSRRGRSNGREEVDVEGELEAEVREMEEEQVEEEVEGEVESLQKR